MNVAPIRRESFLDIKNDIQALDVLFRTGGTMSNFSNPYSKNGYGFEFLDVLKNGTSQLMQIYMNQLFWSKNYLDIMGEVLHDKRILYVANIFRPASEAEYAIKRLEDYNCKVQVGLGNEQFLKIRGLSGKAYVEACKKFAFLRKDYKVYYQLTKGLLAKEIEFNKAVLPYGEYFDVHHYFKPTDKETPRELLTRLKNLAGNLCLSEWNLEESYEDNPEGNVALAKDVIQICGDLGIDYVYHNLVSDDYGVFDNSLKRRNDLYNLFPKVK